MFLIQMTSVLMNTETAVHTEGCHVWTGLMLEQAKSCGSWREGGSVHPRTLALSSELQENAFL